ncbi:MAG: cold shock domain-containing protein [Stenotrophomonas sp.]
MRTHGTLTKWNDDRGFGFISPAQGNEEVFVHISAFPRDGERPRINELISFETETGPNGKLRAIRVMRPGQRSASPRSLAKKHPNQSPGIVGVVLTLLAIAAIGVYGYSRFTRAAHEPPAAQAATASPTPSTFKCDGRTMCSQMTSCAEARYFLKHCPNTKMDGNNDGEPCEQQWCN